MPHPHTLLHSLPPSCHHHHTCAHVLTPSLKLVPTPSLPHTCPRILTPSHPHIFTPILSHPHFLTPSLPLPHPHLHYPTLTPPPPNTLLPHPHSLTPSLFPLADGLLKMLYMVLLHQQMRHPGAPKSSSSALTPTPSSSSFLETDIGSITLALQTLGSFNFGG